MCMHTCVHLGACASVCTCAYVYAHLCAPVYVHLRAYVHLWALVCTWHLWARVYMLLCVHVSVCTHLQTPVHTCTEVCTSVPHLPSSDVYHQLSRTAPSAPTLPNDNLGYSSLKPGFLPKGPSGLRGNEHCILCI